MQDTHPKKAMALKDALKRYEAKVELERQQNEKMIKEHLDRGQKDRADDVAYTEEQRKRNLDNKEKLVEQMHEQKSSAKQAREDLFAAWPTTFGPGEGETETGMLKDRKMKQTDGQRKDLLN